MAISNYAKTAKGLVSTTGWTFIGNALGAAIQLLQLLLIASLFAPEVVADWGAAWAFATPMALFATLNLPTISSADIDNRFKQREMFLLLGISFIAIGILSIATTGPFSSTNTISLLTIQMLVCRGAESASALQLARLLRENQTKSFALISVSRTITASLVFACVLVLSQSPGVALLSAAASQGCMMLLHTSSRGPRIYPVSTSSPIKALILIALAGGIFSLSLSLESYLPRIVSASILSTSDMAQLTIAGQLSLAAVVIMRAVDQAMVPTFARMRLSGDAIATARITALIVIAVGIIGSPIVYLAAKLLVHYLLPSHYRGSEALIALLTVGNVVKMCAVPYSAILRSSNRYGMLILFYVSCAVLTSLIVLAAYSRMGLLGVGVSIIIGQAALSCGLIVTIEFTMKQWPGKTTLRVESMAA